MFVLAEGCVIANRKLWRAASRGEQIYMDDERQEKSSAAQLAGEYEDMRVIERKKM